MMFDVQHGGYDADIVRQKSDIAIVCYISKVNDENMLQGSFWFSQTAPGSTRGTLLAATVGTGPSSRPIAERPAAPKTHDSCVLTHAEMIQNLVKDGLSVSMLAEIFNVTRPTIYSWQEGTAPQADKQNRIELVAKLLASTDARRLSLMSKVWNRSVGDIPSLFVILTAKTIDASGFHNALSAIEPLFLKLIAKEKNQRKSVSDLVSETMSVEAPPLKNWDQMQPLGMEIV
jgi:hypothetical protein